MLIRRFIVTVTFLACLVICPAAWAVEIEFVPVGDKGNLADPDTGFGRVDYEYQMGKYDVTAGQYCEFLNAVAKAADPYGLYNPQMNVATYELGCNIKRSGPAGNYTYTVADDWANRPVNFVSWGDAARFCNWLQTGTTENGAYTLGGAISNEALMAVTRNADALYFLPTANESYKAGYYDPNKYGQDQPGYWFYPTKHDTPPSNILDPLGTNNANFADDVAHHDTIGPPYFRTEVGAFAASPSPYGTYDQGANVSNWTETSVGGGRSGYGTNFGSPYVFMYKGGPWIGTYPTNESPAKGFRVGSMTVPEPSVIVLMVLFLLSGCLWGRILKK